MASVPMRVDVCVQFTTKNKKLFVDATFPLALCARPYPPPSKQNGHTVRMVFDLWVMWTMWTTSFKSHTLRSLYPNQ